MSIAILLVTVFVAGTALGYFIATLLEHFRLEKTRRTQQQMARSRIIASIKQEHEKEIIQQIFQTVEAIHEDTEKTLSRLAGRLKDLLSMNWNSDEAEASTSWKGKAAKAGSYRFRRRSANRNRA